jgi:hypothetical protein
MLRICCLLALLLCAGLAFAKGAPDKPTRVLFVGNSLTYVHDLPAVFTALAQSQGRTVEAAMLVRGGATLTQHLASGVLTPQLLAKFDTVVLQERGGDLVCAEYSPEMIQHCQASREAHAKLVQQVRAAGAEPILLGTSQPQADASRQLQENEAQLGRELGATTVVVSETVRRAMEQRPSADWISPDHHPGEEHTLLVAIELYRAVFGVLPKPRDLLVKGEDYAASAHFSGLEVLPEPRGSAMRGSTASRIATLLDDVATQPAPK